MKDIVISRNRQIKELLVFLLCFLIAFGLNVYAIIEYDGKWNELFWSLGFVLTATIVLYVLIGLIRIVLHCLFNCRKKKRR